MRRKKERERGIGTNMDDKQVVDKIILHLEESREKEARERGERTESFWYRWMKGK